MQNSAATESQQSLSLHRVLEDEYMNLHGPLPEGYPWCFTHSQLSDPNAPDDSLAFLEHLYRDSSKLADELRDQLIKIVKGQSPNAPKLLEWSDLSNLEKAKKDQKELCHRFLRPALASFLNSKLDNEAFRNSFEKSQVDEARRVVAQYLPHNNLSLVNRLLLEGAFPNWIKKKSLQEKPDSIPASSSDSSMDATDPENINKAKQQWLEKQSLSTIHALIHDQKPTALCLSGGGIRSATFNLGILQGLARKRLIGKFDYLSTVSGGGYVGSWLTAWIHRHPNGVDGVMKELGDKPASALEPDPPEITHLRTYSNYLSPQTGLLSADTWTLTATVIRNLFLNWLVFIPLLVAVLMVPRIYVAAVLYPTSDLWQPWSLAFGFILALVSVSYIGLYLPSKDDRSSNQNRFLVQCLIPIVLSAIAVTFFWARYNSARTVNLFWARYTYETKWHGWKDYFGIESERSVMIGFMVLTTMLIMFGWGLYVYSRRNALAGYVDDSYRLHKKNMTLKVVFYLLLAIGVIIIAGSVTGGLIWKLSYYFRHSFIFGDETNPWGHIRTYVVFAVPLLLAFLMLGATLLVGLTSRYNKDEEQEWFARFAGWILIVIVSWVAITGLVLSSADLADHPWQIPYIQGSALWKFLAAAIGVISGLVTVLGGFSSQTKAYVQAEDNTPIRKDEKKGIGARLRKSLPSLAAPIFFVFLVIVLSLATNLLMIHLSPLFGDLLSRINLSYQQSDLSKYADHRDIIRYSGLQLLILTTLLMGLFGWIMGLLIDTGKFSIHSMYSNRLKRAYLGASRKKRTPNWFTNFDSSDDLPMHELRHALFNEKRFTDLPGLIDELINSHDQLSNDLRQKLSPTTIHLMQTYKPTGAPSKELLHALIQDLNNNLLDGDCIYVEERYPEPKKEITRQMLKQELQGESRVLLNRLYLEEAYPDKIERIIEKLKGKSLSRPIHVVNMALNLMRGDRLAWQERKAETFTVSPLHSGNHLLGYRRSRYYGGEDGITLGTAFTISGAAASPNMGYMLSSPLVSFLMAMFNVRLGWWLGNPGPAGDRTFGRDAPQFAVGPIVAEALSMSDDKSSYVYLSDGGHFENLGLYEMVLRRCHLIVVSDASTDPDYKFDSLGMALRKIRIDLGIPIEFDDFKIHNKSAGAGTKYVAIGDIRYSCVDDDCTDGILIYIKASLSGDEPRDVLHYQQENQDFPQEFIGDQWFSESQFESYRALGSHIIDAISEKEKARIDLGEFVKMVQEYINRPR